MLWCVNKNQITMTLRELINKLESLSNNGENDNLDVLGGDWNKPIPDNIADVFEDEYGYYHFIRIDFNRE